MQQRKAKESEKKSDKKNQDEEDSSASTVKRTALQTSAGSRDSVKPDRFNKTASKKSTQAPKIEPFPVSAFETTIVDFHKLQSLRSSEILNAHRKNGPACSVESNIMCLSQPQMSPLLNTELSSGKCFYSHSYDTREDVSVESIASSKALKETVASLIPSSFDSGGKYC